MFSVYGVSGEMFRGSMEQLRQIDGINAIARANAIPAVGRDGCDAASVSPHELFGGSKPAPSDEAHCTALAAYAQTQPVVLPRHPLRWVDELMARTVITLPDTATVLAAWQWLARHGVGQAPVVNGAGTLVGLLCS